MSRIAALVGSIALSWSVAAFGQEPDLEAFLANPTRQACREWAATKTSRLPELAAAYPTTTDQRSRIAIVRTISAMATDVEGRDEFLAALIASDGPFDHLREETTPASAPTDQERAEASLGLLLDRPADRERLRDFLLYDDSSYWRHKWWECDFAFHEGRGRAVLRTIVDRALSLRIGEESWDYDDDHERDVGGLIKAVDRDFPHEYDELMAPYVAKLAELAMVPGPDSEGPLAYLSDLSSLWLGLFRSDETRWALVDRILSSARSAIADEDSATIGEVVAAAVGSVRLAPPASRRKALAQFYFNDRTTPRSEHETFEETWRRRDRLMAFHRLISALNDRKEGLAGDPRSERMEMEGRRDREDPEVPFSSTTSALAQTLVLENAVAIFTSDIDEFVTEMHAEAAAFEKPDEIVRTLIMTNDADSVIGGLRLLRGLPRRRWEQTIVERVWELSLFRFPAVPEEVRIEAAATRLRLTDDDSKNASAILSEIRSEEPERRKHALTLSAAVASDSEEFARAVARVLKNDPDEDVRLHAVQQAGMGLTRARQAGQRSALAESRAFGIALFGYARTAVPPGDAQAEWTDAQRRNVETLRQTAEAYALASPHAESVLKEAVGTGDPRILLIAVPLLETSLGESCERLADSLDDFPEGAGESNSYSNKALEISLSMLDGQIRRIALGKRKNDDGPMNVNAPDRIGKALKASFPLVEALKNYEKDADPARSQYARTTLDELRKLLSEENADEAGEAGPPSEETQEPAEAAGRPPLGGEAGESKEDAGASPQAASDGEPG